MPLSHHWNHSKTPIPGVQMSPPAAHRNQVRVMLSDPEDAALGFVRHHSANPQWLRLALDIETARCVRRVAVLKLLRELLAKF